MDLMPLADMLEGAAVGVKGQTVFLHMMPEDAEKAVLLRSPLSGTKINYEIKGYYRTDFQVIVRSHSYAEADALMKAVIATLTMSEKSVNNELYFQFCRPLTEPVAFPLSKGNLLEFNVSFDCCFVKAA